MNCSRLYITILSAGLFISCSSTKNTGKVNVLSGERRTEKVSSTSAHAGVKKEDEKKPAVKAPMCSMAEPLDINRGEFIDFAKRYLGVPYKYASAEPSKGFDCSGLLYHVFGHFNVKSPRSSYAYENVGKDVELEKAKPGDLVLFTTTGDTTKIGHIGILTEVKPRPAFLHASTSKGVIISNFTGYYVRHFVKAIRVLK